MLKDVLGAIGTRYLIAMLTLALVFVNVRALGVEGVGVAGLIWASVNINATKRQWDTASEPGIY